MTSATLQRKRDASCTISRTGARVQSEPIRDFDFACLHDANALIVMEKPRAAL